MKYRLGLGAYVVFCAQGIFSIIYDYAYDKGVKYGGTPVSVDCRDVSGDHNDDIIVTSSSGKAYTFLAQPNGSYRILAQVKKADKDSLISRINAEADSIEARVQRIE